MLTPALFALSAGVAFAGAGVFLRRALPWVAPYTAAFLSVHFTAIFVWIVTLATVPVGRFAATEVFYFLAAGLAAPGFARLVYYTGIARVGVARATALLSVAPIFAVALAMLTLGERPSVAALLGVMAVVGGGTLLSHRSRDDRTWRRRDLVLPVLGALGFAVRDIVSRRGLAVYPEPMIAAAGATFASVGLMWVLALLRVIPVTRPPARAMLFLALSGLCECFAYLTMWRALATAPVSLVSPLVHAQPLFTIALTAVFLRDVERLTWRVIVASLLIVAGVTCVLRFT